MFVYTLRSRDGQVRRVTTEKKLTTEELEELDYRLFEDISMTPGDIVRGAKANVSDLFFSAGELLTDFSAGAAEKEQSLTYVTPGARQVIAELEPEYKTASSLAEFERQSELREISNSIREARIEAREEITAPTPLRVQESFGYQAADAITQLGSQLALAGAGTLAAGPAGAAAALAGGIIPLGYTIGKDDYYRSIGKTPSTATVEEQQTAESVGTINAINTYALNTIGIRGIQRAFLKNKKINKKFFKLAEEGKLTKDSIKDITKDIGKAALGEGFTEAGDEASLNILANSLFGYDPERETLEGTGKALALGAIGGGAFGTVASTRRIGRQLPAIPLKAISNATKAVSGVSKSLASGTLKARDMVKGSPLTAKILDGLMKKGIDISKVTETISKKVVPITKESIESLKNNDVFKKVKSTFDKIVRPLVSQISSK